MDVMALRRLLILGQQEDDNMVIDSTNAAGTLIADKYIGTGGSELTYNGWSATDYIDISNGFAINMSSNSSFGYNALYDENYNFISGTDYPNITIATGGDKTNDAFNYYSFFVPKNSNAKYLRMSGTTESMQNLIVKRILKGTITTS